MTGDFGQCTHALEAAMFDHRQRSPSPLRRQPLGPPLPSWLSVTGRTRAFAVRTGPGPSGHQNQHRSAPPRSLTGVLPAADQIFTAWAHPGGRFTAQAGRTMLERLLEHLRYAVALRACSEQARHPAERHLFMTLAAVHEAQAHRAMRKVQQARSAKADTTTVPDRERRDPATTGIGSRARNASHGHPRAPLSGARPRYR